MKSGKRLFPFKYKLTILCFTIVIVVASFAGIFQYLHTKKILATDFDQNKLLIRNNVVNAVSNADHMYIIIENMLVPNIKKTLNRVNAQYAKKHSIDFDLKPIIKNESNFTLYIIDASNKIIKTTDKGDLGLDFNKYPSFTKLLASVRNRNDILFDRLDVSINANRIFKFSYLASADKKYIFEVGIDLQKYTDFFKGVGFDTFKTSLTNTTDFVDSITLYHASGKSYDENTNHSFIRVKEKNLPLLKQAIATKKIVEANGIHNGKKVLYQYIPYQIINSKNSNKINVIEIVYNYTWLNKNLNNNIRTLIFILVIGIIFALILGLYMSNLISRPIEKIILATKEISNGNFKVSTNVKTNDEFEILSNSFDKMASDIYIRGKYLEENNIEILQQKDEINALYEQAAAMNASLENLIVENNKNYLDTVGSLANAIDAKDSYTGGHSERVKNYSLGIAEVLALGTTDLHELEYGSLLHDIGKIGIPESVLNKLGTLTEREHQIINNHPSIGYEILKNVEFLNNSLKIVVEHHERMDGTGYPNGLKGNEIHLLARIACVADAYDAMTSIRPYRKTPLTKEMAIEELIKNKGTQFDPEIVDAFLKWIEIHNHEL